MTCDNIFSLDVYKRQPQGHVVDVKSSNILDKYPGINDIIHFLDPNRSLETRFLRDVRDQTRMNSDAYVFPYTLQDVYKRQRIYCRMS